MCPYLCLANKSASSNSRLCSHIYALVMGSFILLLKCFLQFLFDSIKITKIISEVDKCYFYACSVYL